MKKMILLMCIVVCVFIIGFFIQKISRKNTLIIPNVDDIKTSGYPVNDMGETYGPDIKGLQNPDLLLAWGENSTIGYIRLEEMIKVADTLEEALESNKKKETYSIKLYLQDGKTVIDSFVVEKPIVEMR